MRILCQIVLQTFFKTSQMVNIAEIFLVGNIINEIESSQHCLDEQLMVIVVSTQSL